MSINLGESELEIMKVLWNAAHPMTSTEINEAVSHRQWKKTTIATFLTRLTEKGAVAAERNGKIYHYTAAITADEYKSSQTKHLLKSLFGGSVKDFAAALFENATLNENDIEELRAIINSKEE